MTRQQLKLWRAALTLILLSLVAALFFLTHSPTPPAKHVHMTCTAPVQIEPSRGERVLVMEATAYCMGTITKTGTTPTEGRTVAVDESVIPLGSHLTINGVPGYVAEDTGDAVKGYTVDLYMTDHTRCLEWGRQQVRVEKE